MSTSGSSSAPGAPPGLLQGLSSARMARDVNGNAAASATAEYVCPATVKAGELNALLAAFCARTLPRQEWNHRAHLCVGAWHILHYGVEESVRRLRIAIRALNDVHGTPNSVTSGYHETITVAQLRLIDLSLAIDPDVGHLLESRLAHSRYVFCFYSEALLTSPRARSEYLEPDLSPLAVMRLLRKGVCRRMPWKNGGGWTEELAIYPADATVRDSHSLQRCAIRGELDIPAGAEIVAIYCAEGSVEVSLRSGGEFLAAGDIVLVNTATPTGVRLSAPRNAVVLVSRIHPNPSPLISATG